MTTDIITFSEKLLQRLKERNVFEEGADFNATGKTLSAIREAIIELRQMVLASKFRSEDEEIRFFKEIKPLLLSQYYYNRKKFNVQLLDSFQDIPSRKNNYQKVLAKMQRFALSNKNFYQYCVSGRSDNDRECFVRKGNTSHKITFDHVFSTSYDIILSKLLAHKMLKDFVMGRIYSLDHESQKANPVLNWTDSKVALIELIYALHVSGTINNNKSEIKQIVIAFQQLFDIDLGNYARVFAEIRIRKNGQTTFLDRLRENLLNRIDEFNS